MNLLIMGPPGAGKGTQATSIAEYYKVPHISTGDIFRAAIKNETSLGLKAKEYMDSGMLVPDEVTNGMVKERLAEADCVNGFLLDGYPRTLEQAKVLQTILSDLGKKIDHVINIDVDSQILIERMIFRRSCADCKRVYNIKSNPPKESGVCDHCGGKLFQREDDELDTVTRRLEIYEEKTKVLLDFYKDSNLVRNINGTQAIDVVFEDIKTSIGE